MSAFFKIGTSVVAGLMLAALAGSARASYPESQSSAESAQMKADAARTRAAELAAQGVKVSIADGVPGFPCRVTLRDAPAGSRMLLLNFEHQPAETAYRSRHAIYVEDGAREFRPAAGEVPDSLRIRLLSIRAFDKDGMMVDADVTPGQEAAAVFERMLAAPEVAYLQVHNAKRGCYAARVERA